ncbi:hypothetical protein [Streptomyces siamensis]
MTRQRDFPWAPSATTATLPPGPARDVDLDVGLTALLDGFELLIRPA